MNSAQSTRQGLNVAIGGPQGVGKSTVLRLVASGRTDYEAISVGGRFPADFRTLSGEERTRIRHKANGYLSSKLLANRDRIVLVDLHYLDLREPDPRVQRSEILDLFDLHVLLCLPADLLIARRKADPTRTDRLVSDVDAESDLAAHLKYFRDEIAPGRESLVLDCREGPRYVAEELQRYVDAALTRNRRPR